MKVTRSISSVLLATLVLMASSSFYVDVHLCGGTVKTVAFLQQADDCGHQSLPPCHRLSMKGCCENDQVVHESQEIKGQVTSIVLASLTSIAILHNTIVLAEIIPAVFINYTPYYTDHPPAAGGHDIILSIHSLLI